MKQGDSMRLALLDGNQTDVTPDIVIIEANQDSNWWYIYVLFVPCRTLQGEKVICVFLNDFFYDSLN